MTSKTVGLVGSKAEDERLERKSILFLDERARVRGSRDDGTRGCFFLKLWGYTHTHIRLSMEMLYIVQRKGVSCRPVAMTTAYPGVERRLPVRSIGKGGGDVTTPPADDRPRSVSDNLLCSALARDHASQDRKLVVAARSPGVRIVPLA